MRIALLLLATIALTTSAHAQELTIVANGATDYEIVVGERTTRPALTAARELQEWVQAATGVQIPTTERPHPDRRHLYVGPTEIPADWGISVEQIPPEGFVIKTVGEDMAFVGADRGNDPDQIAGTAAPTWCGTMNAVYDFLEEQVGVRWYWHDDLGTIVPSLAELKVPPLNYTEAPDFIYRALPYGPTDAAGKQAATTTWGRRNRLGKSIQTYHAHAWFQALPVEQYGETHPEYFALVNGERVTRHYSGHHGGQVCTSNPEVIEIFAEYCRRYFRDHPDRTMCSVSPNDGGGFCQCANCTALDVAMWPDDSSRAGHPEMTDRMITFYNAIAEKVVEEFPDRYLGAYVYSYYQAPPHRVKPHPNLALVLAPNTAWAGPVPANWERDGRQMADWAAVHGNMFMYDIFYRGTRSLGHPAPIVDHTSRYLRYMKQIGMRGGYLYIGPTWESLGPGAYLMTKLFWDADADADAFVAKYYADLYGPAAPKVREVFETIERSWVAAIGREGPPELPQAAYFTNKGGSSESCGMLLDCWQPILGPVRDALGQARALATSDAERSRIQRLADQIEFTRASMDALMAIADFESTRDPDPNSATRVRAGIEAREAVLERIAETWSPHFRDWVRATDDSVQSPLRPSAAYFTLAGDAARARLYAQLAEAAPVVDGDPSDAAWQAAVFGSFRENHGANEAAAPTSAALCYDVENLYVLFRCEEPNMEALKPETLDRDSAQLFATDNVEVFIDPDGDGLDYYHFAVNAGGSVYDSLSRSPDEHLADWDGNWQSAVKIGETGWAVELRIPLQTLGGVNTADGQTWRINLHRTRRGTAGGKSEYQALSPTLGGYHQPGRFAELRFGQPPSGENLLRKWDFERLALGGEGTETLRVSGEGNYSVEIANDRVYETGQSLKIMVGAASLASFTYYPATIAEGSYRFAMRYCADPLLPAEPGRPVETPITRVIFRDSGGNAVSESRLYSWEKASAEAGEGKWADHVHIFRTLPGTERITVTVFFHRPGTWWVDDVSLTEL